MGSGSQVFSIISFIFILIVFVNSQLFMLDAALNARKKSEDEGLQELNSVDDGGDANIDQIKRVPGGDEDEKMKILIFEKFRILIGVKNFNPKSPSNDDPECGLSSPSPAPTIEAETPAPVPVLHKYKHSHPSIRSSPATPSHEIRRKDGHKARARKFIIAIAVSTGATSVLCVLGLILMCRKCLKGRQRRSARSALSGMARGFRDRSKNVDSSNAMSKVSFDPGPELFYLSSLGANSEPESSYPKCSDNVMNISSNQNRLDYILNAGVESGEGTIKAESDSISSSLARLNFSEHESIEELKECELSDCNSSSGDKILPLESYASNEESDESFHSLSDYHSPNKRLSSASESSLSDPVEASSPKFSGTSPASHCSSKTFTLSSHTQFPPATADLKSMQPSNLKTPPSHSPCDPKQQTLAIPCSSSYEQAFPPPPPPPPPPPHHICIFRSHSPFCSKQIKSKSLFASAIPNALSPRNSNSSSGSNETPRSDFRSSPTHKSPQQLAIPLTSTRRVPPPPCPPIPPPFPKEQNKSHILPPPPPSQFPQFTPLGKDGSPLPKLKPLHWDKVRAAPDRSMVWDKLRSSSFELDEEMIESLFGYNKQIMMKNEEAKNKSPSPSDKILEPKRLQNITILSKALNATAKQVCDALMQGDGLCIQQLEALVKMVLTKEEEAKLSNYKGDINELGSAEKFVKEILKVPFAFSRFEAMLYRDTFEDEAIHLRKSFAMLEEACKELRSSPLFLKLLEAVLRTGNRMNVGTIRGGARAFKLDALLKLSDVKGTDGRTSLLHFVVQEMIRSGGVRESEITIGKNSQKTKARIVDEMEEANRRMSLDLVSQLSSELRNVKKTATIDLDVLLSSVSNLSDGMARLHRLVHGDLGVDEQNGGFVISMKSFLNYAETSIKELQEDENRVLLHVREITEYFHGDVSKDEANPLRIFVIVRDFLGMLDRVCKELRSSKIPSTPNPLAPFR